MIYQFGTRVVCVNIMTPLFLPVFGPYGYA